MFELRVSLRQSTYNSIRKCLDDSMLTPLRTCSPQEHAALIEQLWAQGSVALENGRPVDEKESLACIAFGTDDFAGDREVACFLTSAAALAEVETAATATATSLAAAKTGPPGEEVAVSQTLQRWSLLPPGAAVTLIAVPIHTDKPSCRYNPYHLRIIGREVDGAAERRPEEVMVEDTDDSYDDLDYCEDESLREEMSPRQEGVARPNGDGGGERGKQERGQAQADEPNAYGVAGGGADIERAYFSLKGAAYVLSLIHI